MKRRTTRETIAAAATFAFALSMSAACAEVEAASGPSATPTAAPAAALSTAGLGPALVTAALKPMPKDLKGPALKPAVTQKPAHRGNYRRISGRRNIHYILIHVTEGSYASALSWFQNSRSKVSAHYTVAKDGRVAQSVPDKDVAWHVRGLNSQSIGIEHEGWTHTNFWTDEQMVASAKLTRHLALTYGVPIDKKHIIGHVEADAPNDHEDPGEFFDWDWYLYMVATGDYRPAMKNERKAIILVLGKDALETYTPGNGLKRKAAGWSNGQKAHGGENSGGKLKNVARSASGSSR